MEIKATSLDGVWVREDGFVSEHGKDGPWTRGHLSCVNTDRVRKTGSTPKYYFTIKRDFLFLYVHRLVALAFCENPCPQHFRFVDHIFGDSLDNRAENLRWLNHQLNCMNQTGTKNCYFDKRRKTWRALVRVNGELYRWGNFKTFR